MKRLTESTAIKKNTSKRFKFCIKYKNISSIFQFFILLLPHVSQTCIVLLSSLELFDNFSYYADFQIKQNIINKGHYYMNKSSLSCRETFTDSHINVDNSGMDPSVKTLLAGLVLEYFQAVSCFTDVQRSNLLLLWVFAQRSAVCYRQP